MKPKMDELDISRISYIPWEQLRNTAVLITGATGLIGNSLISVLIQANIQMGLQMRIYAVVRDLERARTRFSAYSEVFNSTLHFVVSSVEQLTSVDADIDYIVHGASQTSSRAFIDTPVETMITAIDGTRNLLQIACAKRVKSFVYLSSMEIYGFPEKGKKIRENDIGTFSPFEIRNSYPISKIQCESLCCAYAREFAVPAKIVRLAQTFGPSVNYNDDRIFAYFGRCVKEKTDIILKTKGETERCYLYETDAATAILAVLLKGRNGEAYNAGDESTYCSISEMAHRIAASVGISARYEIQPEEVNGYAKTLYMDLDTEKLRNLGWNPSLITAWCGDM